MPTPAPQLAAAAFALPSGATASGNTITWTGGGDAIAPHVDFTGGGVVLDFTDVLAAAVSRNAIYDFVIYTRNGASGGESGARLRVHGGQKAIFVYDQFNGNNLVGNSATGANPFLRFSPALNTFSVAAGAAAAGPFTTLAAVVASAAYTAAVQADSTFVLYEGGADAGTVSLTLYPQAAAVPGQTITSIKAGAYTDPATWDVGRAPVDGDCPVLNHAVTHDGSTPLVVGRSQAATAGGAGSRALTINGGGSLAYSGSAAGRLTLEYRGDVVVMGPVNAARRVIDAGLGALTLRHNSSLAANPAGTRYLVGCGDTNAMSTIYAGGASATNRNSWAGVAANGALGPQLFASLNGADGTLLGLEMPYTDFVGMGGANDDAINVKFFDNVAPPHDSKFVLRGSVFNGCGRLVFGALGLNADVDLSNVTFVNSRNALNIAAVPMAAGAVAGVRDFRNLVCDQQASLNAAHGGLLDGAVFLGGTTMSSATIVPASAAGVVSVSNPGLTNGAAFDSCTADTPLVDYLAMLNGDVDDPHVFGGIANGAGSAATLRYTGGTLWHYGRSGYAGNAPNGMLSPQSGSRPLTLELDHTLILPNIEGKPSCNMIAPMPNAGRNVMLDVHHLTGAPGDTNELIETYGNDTQFKLRGTLLYRAPVAPPSGAAGLLVGNGGKGATAFNADGFVAKAADLDYNAAEAPLAGYAGKGYDLQIPSGAPGAHDVALAADGARFTWRRLLGAAKPATPLTYVQSLSGNGGLTDAQALALLLAKWAARNTAYDAAYDWRTAVLPYLRTMWTPENAVLATAAHDGTTIGAVQAAASTAPAPGPTVTALGITPSSGTSAGGDVVRYTITEQGTGSPLPAVQVSATNGATVAAVPGQPLQVDVTMPPAPASGAAALGVTVTAAAGGLTTSATRTIPAAAAPAPTPAPGTSGTGLTAAQATQLLADVAAIKTAIGTLPDDVARRAQTLDGWQLPHETPDPTKTEKIAVPQLDGSAAYRPLLYNAAGRPIGVGPVTAGAA